MDLSPDLRSGLAPSVPGGSRSPNSRLDPYGVYGTRSAQRWHIARRRRKWQRNLSVALAVAALLLLLNWWLRPRVPAGAAQWSRELNLVPVAISTPLGPDSMLVAGGDGGLWRVGLGPAGTDVPVFTGAFPLQASPAVAGNVAFVPCQDGALYAVDFNQARTLWSHPSSAPLTSTPLAATWPVAPTGTGVAENAIIMANDVGQVAALSAANGAPLWTTWLGAPAGNGMSFAGKVRPRVYVPVLSGELSQGGLACLDARTGATLWRFPADPHQFGAALAPPAVATDASGEPSRVYFATDDGMVYALDANSGAIIWKQSVDSVAGPKSDLLVSLRGAPVLVNSEVIAGGNDGGVRALDAGTGHVIWTYNTGAPVRLAVQSGAIGQQDAVVVAPDEPELWALDVRTGAPIREWHSQASPVGFALQNDGIVVVGSGGTLQILARGN